MCGMAWAFLLSPRILMAHYEYNNKTFELYDGKGKINSCMHWYKFDTNLQRKPSNYRTRSLWVGSIVNEPAKDIPEAVLPRGFRRATDTDAFFFNSYHRKFNVMDREGQTVTKFFKPTFQEHAVKLCNAPADPSKVSLFSDFRRSE